MHFVYFFSYFCLGALTLLLLESVNGGSAVYDHNYIQTPCNNSRNFTLGANGYQRYGFIEADDDGCYNPNSDCSIRLSVSSGYHITMRLQWIEIEYTDVLIITEASSQHTLNGHCLHANSMYSTSNWMHVEFISNANNSNCFDGFSVYYTSFHYGECSENEFRCLRGGRCIPKEVICDSYDNCGDWSDESSATCAGLSTSTVTIMKPAKSVKSVNSSYDHSYIQAPCNSHRELTPGANGYKRYGYIEADDDGCYNPYPNCRIRLSVSSGYYITVRIQWVAMEKSDMLKITETASTYNIMSENCTPSYSIYSTSNWMNIEFITFANNGNCLGGFRLYYTSFHYGECSENEFRCPVDGRCIPNEVVCDSYDNCGDWSDEVSATCDGWSTSPGTSTGVILKVEYHLLSTILSTLVFIAGSGWSIT